MKTKIFFFSLMLCSALRVFSQTTLTFTSPVSTSNWAIGSCQVISWTGSSIPAFIQQLKISTDGGSTFIQIANLVSSTPTGGSFPYIVPVSFTPSNNCIVQCNASGIFVSDTFTISSSSILLNSPNSTSVWNTGSSHNISWTSTGIDSIKIEYSYNGGISYSTIIASVLASQGSYSWLVPSPQSYNARIRISRVCNTSQFSTSGNFRTGDSTFQFTPTTQLGIIEWYKFPDFNLPSNFKIIWEGYSFNDTSNSPLKHGFSHVMVDPENSFAKNIPVQNKALLWTNIAYNVTPTQPWTATTYKESPWNNDMNAYHNAWNTRLNDYADNWANPTINDSMPIVDIMCADIEARINPNYISTLQGDPIVPPAINALPTAQFINKYKTDMAWLYNQPLQFYKSKDLNSNTKISSYADSPMHTWTLGDYALHTWNDWITNDSVLDYVCVDTTYSQFTDFYNNQDFISPSPYYYSNYHWFGNPANENNYLAYMMFTNEVNDAWTNKEIIDFIWLRYQDTSEIFIEPYMAEASAIFPFFSGANGIWLYDESGYNQPSVAVNTNYSVWEYFIKGLYRLSQYNAMFQGTYQVHIPLPAHTILSNHQPIWRGIVNGNNILIAAQNPYATNDTAITTIVPVQYGSWSDTIVLHGRETFLGLFNMSITNINNDIVKKSSVRIFPNPSSDMFTIELQNVNDFQNTEFVLYDGIGREIERVKINKSVTILEQIFPSGMYFYQVKDNKQFISSGKLIIQ